MTKERERARIEVEIILDSLFCTIMQELSAAVPRTNTSLWMCQRSILQVSGFPRLLFFVAQTVSETEMEMTELQAALWLKQILY